MKRSILFFLIIMLNLNLIGQSNDLAYERKLKKFTKDVDKNVEIFNCRDINTSGYDWAPIFYQDGIVYVSQYRSGHIDPKSGETYYDLFYAEFDTYDLPSKPQVFSIQVNQELNEGPVCFNADQSKMYFTQNNNDSGIIRENDKDITVLKIYEATKGYFDWEKIRELPFNHDNYNCMHPSLSPTGTKLFFASDMPGGYGGFDIYFAENVDGNWSGPINLGPEINTGKDEEMPMIHSSGILFFASKGHKGFGGYDLFMVDISTASWGNVLNLGQPFNSKADDFGICLSEEGKSGFFTSSRDGGLGKHDIYRFETTEGIRGVFLSNALQTKVSVLDQTSGKALANVNLRYFPVSPNGMLEKKELYDIEIQPSQNNEREYNFIRKRKNEQDLQSPDARTDHNGLAYLPLAEGKDYIILASKIGYSAKEVKYILKERTYNQSIEIAMKEQKCITLHGAVFVEGFPDKSLLGTKVTIINQSDGSVEEVNSNVNGNFEACLQLGSKFRIIAEKDGFQNKETSITTVDTRKRRFANVDIFLAPKTSESLSQPILKGSKLILENIFYEFNSDKIIKGASKDLEKLIELMSKYPTMQVKLGAHTDSRGEKLYNQSLSLKRAESAKLYLVKNGVAAHRIKVFGYGESQIRNHCFDGVKCSEKEHQYNRRTEAHIIEINEQ